MVKKDVILLIDDDEELLELTSTYLKGYGFTVLSLPEGSEAASTVRNEHPGVVILDVMMPGKNGLEVLRDIRACSVVPVIMLTAKGEDTDRIVGLELGADDYMAKPFNPRELLARIKALLRRYEIISSETTREKNLQILRSDGLTLNTSRQILEVQGDELELSATEFRLLKVFMEHPDTAMTRDDLMTLVWDKNFSACDRSIDVHVHKLRSILKPYKDQKNRIKTVWGTGYLFVGMR
jgi:two-component system phosphate regulon response regulator OmpR